MNWFDHFRMMASYNRIANERVYECCAQLEDAEYRMERRGSMGSIHGLLNHILLGDRIWMGRFEGGGQATPRLTTVLYDDFTALREARAAEDARIERFFAAPARGVLDRRIAYTNNLGQEREDDPEVVLAHFFNHQTHHRGQIHVMLSQTPVAPPSLDLHRIILP